MNRPSLARRILVGVEGDRRTISEVAERGLDRPVPAEARALRQRNVPAAMGVSQPGRAEGPRELRGAACPEPGEG